MSGHAKDELHIASAGSAADVAEAAAAARAIDADPNTSIHVFVDHANIVHGARTWALLSAPWPPARWL